MAGVVEPSSTLTLARGLAEAARALRANAGEAASFNARAIGADKLLLVFLTGSTAAFLRLAQGESSDLGHERRLRAKAERDSAMRTAASLAALEPAKAAEVAPAPTATSAPAPVARRRKGRPESFWADLRFLMAIALPGGPLSRGGALLGTQFGLLVVRTLLTVRATKTSTFFLTKSIAMASWKYWTRWVVHFGGWCCSATVVNSGLRYVETLLAVELRNALTRAAHARYTKGNAFYRTSVLHQGTVDHVDQRICADIEAFSREAARLYGHRRVPSPAHPPVPCRGWGRLGRAARPHKQTEPSAAATLTRTLLNTRSPQFQAAAGVRAVAQRIGQRTWVEPPRRALQACAGPGCIGRLRVNFSHAPTRSPPPQRPPITYCSSQIVVTALLRSVTPPLGRMVAKEAALEGGFRAAHSRLIAHAEEIAFLRGGDTERAILNTRFSALMSTQRWHALQRIRKSVAENIGKFQGLFVGGVFVHSALTGSSDKGLLDCLSWPPLTRPAGCPCTQSPSCCAPTRPRETASPRSARPRSSCCAPAPRSWT